MMVHSPSYLEVILFSLVRYLSKKKTKIDFFFLKKKTKTEPKPVQTDRFWFGYFGIKTGSNRFGFVFSGLAQFFSVWVRFGFFSFKFIKSKPNRLVFLNSNRVFFTVRFFQLFFSAFLDLISFLIFFSHSYLYLNLTHYFFSSSTY